MKKRILLTVLVIVLVLMFGAACAGAMAPDGDSGWSDAPAAGTPGAPPSGGGNQGDGSAHTGEITAQERLIVYTVTFAIHSQNFGETLAFLRGSLDTSATIPAEREWFHSQNIQYQNRHAVLVARVRSTRLHEFIDSIMDEVGMENIREFDERGTDVSLTHRNREGQILEYQRYLEWLDEEMERAVTRNASFNERATIQNRINAAQTRLNTLITAQNTLNQQILFSTVTITLRESYPVPIEPPSRTREVLQNIWRVISSILIGLAYVLAVAVPLAAVTLPTVFLSIHFARKNRAKKQALAATDGGTLNTVLPRPHYPHTPHTSHHSYSGTGHYPQAEAPYVSRPTPEVENITQAESIVNDAEKEAITNAQLTKKSSAKK